MPTIVWMLLWRFMKVLHVWAKEHRVMMAVHARLPDGAPRTVIYALQRPRHAMGRQSHGE